MNIIFLEHFNMIIIDQNSIGLDAIFSKFIVSPLPYFLQIRLWHQKSFTAKKGTVVRNISLVPDNAGQIEGRVNGQRIVILTQYVKKN